MPDMVLLEERRFYQNPRFWRWFVFIVFLLISVWAFQPEFLSMRVFLGDWLNGREELMALFKRKEFQILAVNILGFILFFFGGLMIASQFLLPVQTLDERSKVFDRILRYLVRRHGPAVFVKEARTIGHADELESSFPGVVFVDLCSAIALENQLVPVAPKAWTEPGQIPIRRPRRFHRLSIFRMRQRRNVIPVRVAGPGLVFTEWGEKLRGVADLRRQFRLIPNVSFATRDGFSVLSHVFVILSLGEKADVLKVTLQGDTADDIRSVRVDERTRKIAGFRDELDAADKAEIFQFIRNYQPETLEEIFPEQADLPPVKAPYVYDPERVFTAIYAESRNTASNAMEPWSDLPPRVAIEVFRDMLSLERFNDLYRPDQPYEEGQSETFPFLEGFRNEFSQRVRNLGVLAFQVVRRRNGRQLKVGDRWNENELEILPERNLRNSKVLRNRGIRVVVAGFPELNPAHPGVREELVKYWSARWKREAEQTEAEHMLEAMRMQTKARAEAQRDMVDVLQRIYSLPELSQEAMSVRLFQALEQTAADPRTRQLLPQDSLTFLWGLRQWLMPGSQEET